MSPRPRKVTDDQVFAATYRAMQRLGPGELTLAAIAAEAGVTAGALAQRFGSKRELLLALAAATAATAGDLVRGVRSAHRSPLAALRAYAECLGGLAASPAAFARNLAYLWIDLTDPDFRQHLSAQARAVRVALRELLDAAEADRELVRGTDTLALAKSVEVALSGALFTWAVDRDGRVETALRDAVDRVVAPFTPRKRLGHGRRSRSA